MRGGIIGLNGDWIVNHYGGDEAFFGWLMLQPRFHRIEFADLTVYEAEALGGNIQRIDLALRQYWAIRFENDPIQRVYVVYFRESVFDTSDSGDHGLESHMHIHLIPRTIRLGQLLRDISPDKTIRAWNIPDIVRLKEADLPPGYKKNNQNMSALVTYLRSSLATTRSEG
jgi:diadenosine tetraphosphate (Ap4A) HIT family hydrolase